jgi:hypothetical protein
MKWFRLNFFIVLFFVLMLPVTRLRSADSADAVNSEEPTIKLIAPFENKKVVSGPMVFLWKPSSQFKSSDLHIWDYRITFWSRNRRFVKSYSVPVPETDRVVSLRLDECRSVFRRHGQYFWQVTTGDETSTKASSEIRSFTVRLSSFRERSAVWYYPYGIFLYYANRLRTPDYQAFLQQVKAERHMKNYADLGFIFRQQRIGKHFVEFEEKFFIRSPIGMGMETGMRIRLLQNRYLSFYPRINGSIGWYATGIEKYSSLLYRGYLGCDFSVMPKGYLTLQAGWVPFYRVRYSEKENGPRTFLGQGWALGAQFIFPQTLIKNFRFLGVDFDFRRIPFSYHMSRIRDQYTGTVMKIQGVNIGYIF